MSNEAYVDVVTECGNCPYAGDTVRADVDCNHPYIPGRFLVVFAEDGNPPAACPLRKGPTTVRLEVA